MECGQFSNAILNFVLSTYADQIQTHRVQLAFAAKFIQ